MPLSRAFLQTLGATLLLALALACHGKKTTDPAAQATATLSGTITYSRVPLAFDASGVPTGLVDSTVATNLKSLPARGATIRAYQQIEQTLPNSSTTTLVWALAGMSTTDSTGAYSIEVTNNRPTMVEVLSLFGTNTGVDTINLVAEPTGINSTALAGSRLCYALRKAADGTAPAGTNAPVSKVSGNAVVNFTVGLTDTWWVVNPSYNRTTGLAQNVVETAVLETTLPGRTAGQGTGSRILGIGDSIASFITAYGSATAGSVLDLHYWPGRSEARGSFIEYNRSLYPQALDAAVGKVHYFGSLQAGPGNDDAWDEGVLLPLLARNVLYTGLVGRNFSVPLNVLYPPCAALTDLSPDIARIEGLADAMAANVLKSPFLADTQGTALAAAPRDIRSIATLGAGQLSPFSAPAIRALGWEVILKANSLPTPGTATDWASINSLTAARFFLAPSGAGSVVDSAGRDLEPLNIFSQLNRLKEAKLSTETVDLAAIFTEKVLTTLASPFGIPWPRPTTGSYASFGSVWGSDPSGTLTPVVLSMAKATQVDGVYPNLSQGELYYASFTLNADKRCVLSAVISPALPADARVELDLPGLSQTFSFAGVGGSMGTITLPVPVASPFFHTVRMRLKSPTTQVPDTTVTLTLTPAP